MSEPKSYGATRNRRPTISYAEFERTADALLAAGDKPGLENVRKAIGGSPETIRQMLRRYWAALAALKRSPPESLMRMPTEIADLADELWQRSLSLAAQSAAHDDNAARERLEQVKRENELRSHAVSIRERTLGERQESSDKTVREMQEQVAALLTIVSRNTETIVSLRESKADVEAQAETYRQRLGRIVARAVAQNQKVQIEPRKPQKRPKAAKKTKTTRVLRKKVAQRYSKRRNLGARKVRSGKSRMR